MSGNDTGEDLLAMTGEDLLAMLLADPNALGAFLAASAGTDAGPDPLDVWSGLPMDMPVVTRTVEAMTPADVYGAPPGEAPGLVPAHDVVDVTARDVVEWYIAAPEATRGELHERLYTDNRYSPNARPDDIHHPALARNALEYAIKWYATQNQNPVEALPAADKSLFAVEEEAGPVAAEPRRATVAQIGLLADQMAKSLLGRRASDRERNAAVAIARRFENAGQSYGAVDFEAPLRFVAGDEADRQATSRTLAMFDQIVKGR